MLVTKTIILSNQAVLNHVRDMVNNYDIFETARVNGHFKTYSESLSSHHSITIEGRAKDIFAVEAIARFAGRLALLAKNKNRIEVGEHLIEIKRREYEVDKFTHDIYLDGNIHSQAVGDELLDEMIGRVVNYARKL